MGIELLKMYWSTIWRVVVVVLVATVVWWTVNTIVQWREDSQELPLVKAKAAEELLLARQQLELVEAQFDVAYTASEGYQRELEKLRNAPRQPAPVIRVCKPAARPVASGAGTANTGPDAAATAAGVVQGTTEFDTGPLYDLADQCDRLSAQLRALQEFELKR